MGIFSDLEIHFCNFSDSLNHIIGPFVIVGNVCSLWVIGMNNTKNEMVGHKRQISLNSWHFKTNNNNLPAKKKSELHKKTDIFSLTVIIIKNTQVTIINKWKSSESWECKLYSNISKNLAPDYILPNQLIKLETKP